MGGGERAVDPLPTPCGQSATTPDPGELRVRHRLQPTGADDLVTGLSDPAARSAITSAGLHVGTITRQFNCNIPVGQVLAQSPASGAQAPLGSSVNLTEDTHQGSSSAAIHPNLCIP